MTITVPGSSRAACRSSVAISNSSAQSAPANSMCPVTTTLPLKNPAVPLPRCSP
jgi:hypothetical protein